MPIADCVVGDLLVGSVACRHCGSTWVAYTRYHALRCRDCGGYSREQEAIDASFRIEEDTP